jgi:thiosulfate/3-mercaptopyruvate sulfurtransferase
MRGRRTIESKGTMRILRTRSVIVVGLAPLLWAGCSGADEQDAPTGYAEDVLVDAEWIAGRADDGTVRIVEVGGNDEAFSEGHLPGAAFLSMSKLTNPDDPIRAQIATGEQLSAALSGLGLGKDQTVVLYDRHSNRLAARAYWALKYYGHPDVRVFNGGASRWTASERAFSTDVVEYEPSDYEASPADPEIRTTWQYVVDHTDDPSTLICDARSPDEYLGRDVRADRGGHVPGAINVEWTAAVNPNGTFKSPEELRAIYSGAGFAPDKDVITYCQSGVRGAHTWFVLSQLLGYQSVRNYDGSWLEYGNNPESPIGG